MAAWERLTIYVGESDQWHGKPTYVALVEAARSSGLAGATVIRGVMGYGKRKQRQIQTARILELSSDLPMIVTIIDEAEAIAEFIPTVQDMIKGGIVIQETIHLVHHAPNS